MTELEKSFIFQDLVKFRCGVYGIESYETFYDDENIDDLQEFEPESYSRALLGLL